MDIEIIEKKYNPLLEREEVKFEISHQGEPTPTLQDVRKVLRAKLGSKTDLTVVDSIHSHFGSPTSTGFAKVYKDEAALGRIEAKHILNKNFGPKEEEKGTEEPGKAKAEEAPAEESSEEG